MNTTTNYLLNCIDYNIVYQLPYDNNPLKVAAQAINRKIQILTGIDLIRQNVEGEALRLQVHDRRIINLTVNHVWNSCLTPFQRDQFTTLADSANDINQNMARVNDENLNRIIQIGHQVTNNPFENNFFNGTDFQDDDKNIDNIYSLILPAGTGSTGSTFFTS